MAHEKPMENYPKKKSENFTTNLKDNISTK